MPVEIFMRQGGWASISKGSIMVSFKWITIAWTCSSSRFKAVCFISSCEVLLVLVIPALSFIALLNDARKCLRNFIFVLLFQNMSIICISNLSILSVSNKGYSRKGRAH